MEPDVQSRIRKDSSIILILSRISLNSRIHTYFFNVHSNITYA